MTHVMSADNSTASSGRRVVSERRTLAVAAFGAFLAFLDTTIVNVAFPSIRHSFPHASFSTLSWVLNAYNIVFAAMLVAAGRVADLLGRRRAFRVGVAIFIIASGACALAWSVPALIAFRCLQAVGGAILVPASLAVVIAGAAAERRAHAVGLWGASAAVAAGLGPPIGGALVQLSDWRLVFLVNIPLGVAAIAATRNGLVESRAPEFRVLPDLAGTAYLGVALGAVTLGVVEGHRWGWSSPGILACFLLSAALTAALLRSSRRHPSPILDPKLLRIRTFGVANAVMVVGGMGFYAYLLNHILWLRYVWGWSMFKAGLAVAPGAFVAAAVAGPFGRLADKHGHRFVVVPGAVLWALSFWWYVARVGVHPHFLSAWLPGQVMSGIGVGATMPVLTSAGLAAVPGGRYATASAALTSARQLGGTLGIALLVVIFGTPTQTTVVPALRHGWTFVAICFGVVAVGGLLLRRPDAAVEIDEAIGAATVIIGDRSSVELREDLLPESVRRRGLSGVALLADLSPEARRQLTARAKRVSVAAGQWLFHHGDASDALYAVERGRLEVVRDGNVVQELGPGAVLGELGLLTGAPRAASVRARRDSVLLRVARRTFDNVLTADPKAARQLASALARQVQASQAPPRGVAPPTVVSVVGTGRGSAVGAVADALVTELGRHLSVCRPGRVSADGLERAELAHDRVVLTATAGDAAAWRDFCLRQADRVVLVADDNVPPAVQGPALLKGADLMLPDGWPTADEVAGWSELCAPRRFHLASDVGPLARGLAGRSVALALAGGGARSLAHIGVIEELSASGIHIDRVAGCSFGSYIAALFASGLDSAAIDARCYEEFVRRTPHGDYTIPRVALSRGQRGRAMLERTFGDLLIEQLPREFVTVSTDLMSRELVTHRSGSVVDAVGASMSVPGLVPPARVGGRLLVDGGVLDNLPVESLSSTGEGPVIAVNIGPATRTRKGDDPAGPPMPPIGESLMRVLLMSSATALARAREVSAVVITPDTRGVGLLEFHQIDRMRESGRAAARQALAALDGQLGEWQGRDPVLSASR